MQGTNGLGIVCEPVCGQWWVVEASEASACQGHADPKLIVHNIVQVFIEVSGALHSNTVPECARLVDQAFTDDGLEAEFLVALCQFRPGNELAFGVHQVHAAVDDRRRILHGFHDSIYSVGQQCIIRVEPTDDGSRGSPESLVDTVGLPLVRL